MTNLSSSSDKDIEEGLRMRQLYEDLIDLHLEKELRLEADLYEVRKELATTKASFDSPQNINALRNEMHHWRREVDEIRKKLTEAEAFITKQEADIKDKDMTIGELRKRCHELETNNSMVLSQETAAAAADNTYNSA